MTHRIPQSHVLIPHDDFHKLVLDHIGELEAWTRHMTAVKAWDDYCARVQLMQPAGLPPTETHKYPPPQAHKHVEAAIRLDSKNGGSEVTYTPDYEIFYDGPSPEEILASKKNDLLAQAIALELKFEHAIIPPGKRRLLGVRYNDLLGKIAKNQEDLSNLTQEEIVERSKNPIDPLTQEERSFKLDYEGKEKQIQEIHRRFAQIHSDIEDLTIDNVDSYKLPEK